MSLPQKQRSYWGWGYLGESPSEEFVDRVAKMLPVQKQEQRTAPPTLTSLIDSIRKPRFVIDPKFEDWVTADRKERILHHYGKSYRDIVRALEGKYNNPPDYVAFPTTEEQISELLAYASTNKIAIVPFGGGSSVVGGIEMSKLSGYVYIGAITVDMKHFDKVLEVHKDSLTARVQCGVYGPHLAKQLEQYGVTLRHFPQSFEFSTLGGWIVTRAGGHYATVKTHIDQFVVSLRIVTPSGTIQTRKLPSSGAGPSPDNIFLGSEGILGIVTEAWIRVQEPVKFRCGMDIKFPTFEDGVNAVRLISQSGLNPTNCRLVDPMEAMAMGLAVDMSASLMLGFESAVISDLNPYMSKALEICKENKGHWKNEIVTQKEVKNSDNWKQNFISGPYLRDVLVQRGYIVETLETCCSWENVSALINGVNAAVQQCVGEGVAFVTCRFTHIYPDGPAPYFTVISTCEPKKQLATWDKMKEAVSESLLQNGGTITHHHAVGKDHVPFYSKEKHPLYLTALAALKRELDPAWIMNPDVLLPCNNYQLKAKL